MSEFLGNFFKAIRQYFDDFILGGYQGLLFILLVTVSVLVLTIIFSNQFLPRSPRTREFHVLRVLIGSVSVVLSLALGSFCYRWSNTDYYIHSPNQFVHLIIVLGLSLALVLLYIKFASNFDRYKVRNLYLPAFTIGENARFLKGTRKLFDKTKLWLALPLASFLLLLLYFIKPNYLVAVLIDNSSSMEAHVETGKAAISETFSELDDHSDLILSWFTEKNPKQDISRVISMRNWSQLEGKHYFFQDKYQALQHLESIDLVGGTPLYETLHSLFLYAQEQVANTNYAKKVLIIVSDGAEAYIQNDRATLSQILCSNDQFDAFWDDVGLMNMGGDLTGPFFDLAMNQCNYYVEEDATSLSSYKIGLDQMIQEFKHSWFFPIWMASIFGISLVVCLTISPKTY